jgi:hypothetical protein
MVGGLMKRVLDMVSSLFLDVVVEPDRRFGALQAPKRIRNMFR